MLRNLAYLRAMDMDIPGAFSDLTRCAGVILRFPGLCRYTTWSVSLRLFLACTAGYTVACTCSTVLFVMLVLCVRCERALQHVLYVYIALTVGFAWVIPLLGLSSRACQQSVVRLPALLISLMLLRETTVWYVNIR